MLNWMLSQFAKRPYQGRYCIVSKANEAFEIRTQRGASRNLYASPKTTRDAQRK